jgi:hypothetical protein
MMRPSRIVFQEIIQLDSSITKYNEQLKSIQYDSEKYRSVSGKKNGLKKRLLSLIKTYNDTWGYNFHKFYDLLDSVDQSNLDKISNKE